MLQQFYPQVNHNCDFELNKDMHFAAAHKVPTPKAGKCENIHGHTYFVNLTVIGNELNDEGFLVNFADLKKVVHGEYDHQYLNHLEDYSEKQSENFAYPTTEIVAKTIFNRLEDLFSTLPNRPCIAQVIVRETPTSYVIYRGRG